MSIRRDRGAVRGDRVGCCRLGGLERGGGLAMVGWDGRGWMGKGETWPESAGQLSPHSSTAIRDGGPGGRDAGPGGAKSQNEG